MGHDARKSQRKRMLFMQFGTANRRELGFDNCVPRIDDLRIGHCFNQNIFLAVPADRFHKNSWANFPAVNARMGRGRFETYPYDGIAKTID